MNFLCKYLGGSHLYGLNHADSDEDERGLYLSDNLNPLWGFERDKVKVTTTDEKDECFFEFQHFLKLLKKTNTNSMECLFADPSVFTQTHPVFQKMQLNRDRLVNSGTLVHSLRGYTHNEARLALGERTGALGGKRKAQLDRYGFSPKNVSHMVRLSYCSQEFFRTGEYPVSLVGTPVFDLCLDLKVNPQNYTVPEVTELCEDMKSKVENLVDDLNFEFDNDFAVELLVEAYRHLLNVD